MSRADPLRPTVAEVQQEMEERGLPPETARLVAQAVVMRVEAGLSESIEDPEQIAELAGLLAYRPSERRRLRRDQG